MDIRPTYHAFEIHDITTTEKYHPRKNKTTKITTKRITRKRDIQTTRVHVSTKGPNKRPVRTKASPPWTGEQAAPRPRGGPGGSATEEAGDQAALFMGEAWRHTISVDYLGIYIYTCVCIHSRCINSASSAIFRTSSTEGEVVCGLILVIWRIFCFLFRFRLMVKLFSLFIFSFLWLQIIALDCMAMMGLRKKWENKVIVEDKMVGN